MAELFNLVPADFTEGATVEPAGWSYPAVISAVTFDTAPFIRQGGLIVNDADAGGDTGIYFGTVLTPDVADVTVFLGLDAMSTNVNEHLMFVGMDAPGASATHYTVTLADAGGAITVQIRRFVAGAATFPVPFTGSTGFTSPVGPTAIRVVVSYGANVVFNVYVDDVLVKTVTDTHAQRILTPGLVGLRMADGLGFSYFSAATTDAAYTPPAPPEPIERVVLLKVTNIQTIPGTPGNDGTPPIPPTPARSYTVEEIVCQWRVEGGQYGWVTDDAGIPHYVLLPGSEPSVTTYSCEPTLKTIYVPGTPGSPGTPPTPATPAKTIQDYNLGWNSGARSIGFINADGYVEFTPVVATGIVAGFNDTDESPGYFEIEHAWYFSGGVARVYENGAMAHYAGPYVADSDVFKIERRGATVRYYKNDALVYTSSKPSYGPVFLDASLYSGGDMLADAAIAPMVSAGEPDPETGQVGLRIPMMELLGYATGGGGYATATLRVPMPTISAGMLSRATLTVPMLKMLAADRLYGAATLELPMPIMTASGGFPVPSYALATLIVPRPALTAFGLTGEIGGAALTVPMMDMLASEGSYGEATMELPMPRVVASAYEGNGQAFMHELMAPRATLVPQIVTALVMNEDMTVAAVMAMGFTATADMAESLTVDDSLSAAAQRLASMFSVVRVGSAVPVVNAVGGATGPGGVAGDDPYHPDVRLNSDVQVWAMNWDTAATTAYENYAYNSFAVVDGKAYGCKADGIYLLEGDDDEGVPVRASVNFGANDFGTTKHKAVPHAYVGVAADGQLWLRVQVDGGTSYTYQARSVNAAQQVQRFDFGKGLKGSYYTFELFNKDGSDFDLDKIEFMPVALSRRI